MVVRAVPLTCLSACRDCFAFRARACPSLTCDAAPWIAWPMLWPVVITIISVHSDGPASQQMRLTLRGAPPPLDWDCQGFRSLLDFRVVPVFLWHCICFPCSIHLFQHLLVCWTGGVWDPLSSFVDRRLCLVRSIRS